ncbi:MAG: PspC domain-containing protein [Candidatus Kapaibacterium sp.]|nr:PspC domain-containing protein [Bacteroidota bacterium]
MRSTLYRSVGNRKIGGVCAGLAEYFDIDVTLVRIAFVFAVFMHGGGLLAYVIMWMVLPEQPYSYQTQDSDTSMPYTSATINPTRRNGAMFFGILLIVMGTFFLLDNFIPDLDFEDYFPVLLILSGGFILFNSFKKKSIAGTATSFTSESSSSTSNDISYTTTTGVQQ